MPSEDEIKAVEDRLEKRRELLAQRYEDVKLELSSTVSKAVRSWPVLAVAGGLAAGYAIARTGRHRAALPPPSIQYVPVTRPNVESRARTKGILAAVIGIAATALQIGASSEARMFYNAVKRFRDRRRHH